MRARTLPVLLAVLSACRATPVGGTDDPFQERILATLPEGVDVVPPVAFSPDGQQVAYIARTPDGFRAVRGAWRSRRLDAL